MAKQLQLRRGNLSWWTTNNPVLADGEMVLVSTTNDYVYDQYRIGDGLNTFSSLAIHSFPFNTTIEQFLVDAEAARDAAQLAETNAETAETNAEAAEALAEKWATNPENVIVEAGKYSALHWAAKAEDEKLAAEVFKNKADKFANENENVEVESGKYSAKHYSLKAAASAAGIADSAEMLIKHEAEIASLENTINSANINQETTATVSGVDTIALPKTAANTGMQVQMFGQSATQLVTNGNFANGTTGWTAVNAIISVTNSIASITGNGTSAANRVYSNIGNITNGHKFYFKNKVRTLSALTTSFDASIRTVGGDALISNFIRFMSPVQNQWYDFSGIITPTSDAAGATIYLTSEHATSANANGSVMEIDNVMAINLTALGLDSLTKEQCDVLFANYFEGSDNVLGTGRVRSVGKNLFNSTLEVGSLNDISGLPEYVGSNGVRSKNFIGIIPNTQYSLSNNLGYLNLAYWYDSNKNYIYRTISPPYISPINAAYMKIRTSTAGAQNDLAVKFQLEKSSTATPYEPYKESSLYLRTPELRSNGLIKDEIRKGTNGYELVKRVGVGTLGAELITNAADREFSSSDGWTFGGTSEISGGTLKINTPGSVNAAIKLFPSIIGTSNTDYFIVSFDLISLNRATNLLFRAGTSGITYTIPQTKVGQRVYILCNGFGPYDTGWFTIGAVIAEIDNFSIKKVTVLSGGTPSVAITSDSIQIIGTTTINYTLATPVITPIPHAGLLNSNSNGTVYFEPIVADAGVYSSNLAIQLTDCPIASFESIRKYTNGTYTELNTATAVIASGGLSFTHPDLASGDLVMFTYAYNRESIGRSMTLTHYDGRFVEADTANGKVYRIVPVVTNGVVSWTAVEV